VPPSFRLDGKVAVVTGASSGIGARCATALDAAGARVVLVARRKDRLDALASSLTDAEVVEADLMEPEVAVERVREVVTALGRFDVLVNAAGVGVPFAATRESPTLVREQLEVNLVAPMLLSQLAVAVMRHHGGGAIVNITSTEVTNSDRDLPAATYVASKSGLAGLTRELALQWARHGVRVNALAPGWFPTEMNEHLRSSDLATHFVEQIPMRRFGDLCELDGPLLLLASDAGSYITGQSIVVDGGITTV
jgi:NAD(P)-dependent dehydrogenase (short-subunit alcohol dehydrogenase family)